MQMWQKFPGKEVNILINQHGGFSQYLREEVACIAETASFEGAC